MTDAHHGKTVADPERGPASWAVGHGDALTVHGDDIGWNFTDNASERSGWRKQEEGGRRKEKGGGMKEEFLPIIEIQPNKTEKN